MLLSLAGTVLLSLLFGMQADMDCGDFLTQSTAQSYFEEGGSSSTSARRIISSRSRVRAAMPKTRVRARSSSCWAGSRRHESWRGTSSPTMLRSMYRDVLSYLPGLANGGPY